MKFVSKLLTGSLAGAALLASAGVANAAVIFNDIDQLLLNLAGSEFFGATFTDEPGAFEHTFAFELTQPGTANSSLTTTLLAGNDIDFTSISLDGFAFTQTGFDGSGAENWQLDFAALGAGAHQITVTGSVAGASQDGSYSGVLNVATAVIPEPATWGMMILGFGGMGGLLRQRRRLVAHA